jgi:nitrite reductase/ring-hydroxylating ferredoxin subunit
MREGEGDRSYAKTGKKRQTGSTMPDDTRTSRAVEWTRAIGLARLQPSRPIAVKLQGLVLQGEVHACNNRCPHGGYPLVEGTLDADCVLTCHWHNWKFDLKTGATLYGGDKLRVYPVKVEDGAVWLDTRDPPAAERIERALQHLELAMAEYDTARIARELARLGKAAARPELALVRAIQGSHARLRDGMTHAYAVADVWLSLRDALAGETERLACATEPLGYIAYDMLREPAYPFTLNRAPWNAEAFASSVESQDEDGAAALLNGALAQGLHFADLEPALAAAALAHYNDFGHTLIYLMHVRRLIERLGTEVEKPLLLAWLRSLVLATREDLLPDFRHYADALAAWPATTQLSTQPSAQPGTPPGADAVRRTIGAPRAGRDRGCRLQYAARPLFRADGSRRATLAALR